MRTLFLTLVGVAGLTAGAHAMSVPPPAAVQSAVTQVADGCGPGRFRGPGGVCHYNGYNGYDGYRPPGRYACPPGYHLGPMGGRCFPNRY